MSDMTSTGGAGPAAGQERTLYTASGGHRTFFSFVFLILLPFFASLPAMLYMRLKSGLLGDSIGFAVLATAFSILMFLILIELIHALRARIQLHDDKVTMTLPAGRGPTPMLRYRKHEIPYDQIQTVETRREVYGGAWVPVLLKGARIVTKDGTAIPLGYVSENNVDPAFPYPVIAKQIADRARLPLIDRGNVRRSMRRKFLGLAAATASQPELIEEAQIANLNRSHKNVVLALVGGLVVLMAIGIVEDLTSSDSIIGQTAAVSATPPTPPAKPKKP